MISRKQFLGGTALAAGLAAIPRSLRAQSPGSAPTVESYRFDEKNQPAWAKAPLAPGEPGKDYQPSITLNSSTLPFRIVDGVKVFHLICEEVDHVFYSRNSE